MAIGVSQQDYGALTTARCNERANLLRAKKVKASLHNGCVGFRPETKDASAYELIAPGTPPDHDIDVRDHEIRPLKLTALKPRAGSCLLI